MYRFWMALAIALFALPATAQIGSNPRLIEELQTGGGYDESTDGGADFEDDGSIISNGPVVVGDENQKTFDHSGSTFSPRVHITTETGGATAEAIAVGRQVNIAGDDAEIILYRGRDTYGAESIVQSGDSVGSIQFMGHDGDDYVITAQIGSQVDGTPGANDMPGSLIFYVTPDGSSATAAAVTISNDKTVTLAGDIALGANVLSDGILNDVDVFIVDDGDNTKKLAFQISGITTGTTRTWTVPDQNLDFTPTTGDFQGSDTELTEIAGITGNKGDLLVYNGSDWIDLAAGTDTHVLTLDSGEASGVKWAAAAGGGGGANVGLDNLSGVAINTTLVSDTDVTDDLGTEAIRWDDLFAQTVSTGDTAADTLKLRGRDIDGASWEDILTITANNTVTADLSSIVTHGGNTIANLATAQEFAEPINVDHTTLSDGATINWDMSADHHWEVTLGGNRTLANPTNKTEGQTGWIHIVQDGTGSRTVTWGTDYLFPGGTAPTLTTDVNGVDAFGYYVRGTKVEIYTAGKDIK